MAVIFEATYWVLGLLRVRVRVWVLKPLNSKTLKTLNAKIAAARACHLAYTQQMTETLRARLMWSRLTTQQERMPTAQVVKRAFIITIRHTLNVP